MADLRKVVVKLGTSTLTGGSERLSPRRMLEIVRQVATLHEEGHSVLLVSSGAIAAGREVLDHAEIERDIPVKQMLSALGQPRLMAVWGDLFAIYGLKVAQLLLTRGDFAYRGRYLNARDVLFALIEHRVIPVINENDSIATEEIRLGDNDNLSALVANLIDADLLVILTDQPGLYTTDPRNDPKAELISQVERIDESLWERAGGSGSVQGTGGMFTKVQAAQLATRSGARVVIAQGSRPNILLDLLGPEGRGIGTWFDPQATHLESRKRWILSEQPQGHLSIDAGAVRKLRSSNASLLPVGLVRVAGDFERGVIVSILGPAGEEVARGLSKYGSEDLQKLCGAHSSQIEARLGFSYGDEVVRRDQMVIV